LGAVVYVSDAGRLDAQHTSSTHHALEAQLGFDQSNRPAEPAGRIRHHVPRSVRAVPAGVSLRDTRPRDALRHGFRNSLRAAFLTETGRMSGRVREKRAGRTSGRTDFSVLMTSPPSPPGRGLLHKATTGGRSR